MCQITINFDKERYKKLQMLADEDNSDVNSYILNLIKLHLSKCADEENKTVSLSMQEVKNLSEKIFTKRDELYKRLS